MSSQALGPTAASRRRSAAAGYAAAVLADNPLLYLQLNETAGATCANTGSLGGNATCNGSFTRNVASFSANLGVAVTLNASNISYPDTAALDITADVTYECWAKIPAFTSYQTLIAKGIDSSSLPGYDLRVDQTTRTITVLKTNTAALCQSSTPFPNDGAWHHVAFTRSGNTYTIYLDATSVGTATNATAIVANASPLMAGAKPFSASFDEALTGSIDEVAVYNTALSSTRIAAHYAAR